MFPQFPGLAVQKIGPETHRIPRRHRPAELGVFRLHRSSAYREGTRTVQATPGVQCTELEPEICQKNVNRIRKRFEPAGHTWPVDLSVPQRSHGIR